MALHKGWDRVLTTNQGEVMTTGYSTRLAKGQVGIFDMSQENQTKLGNPAVADFTGVPKDRKFEIKVGTHDNGLGRSQTNKSMSSIPFRVGDVKSLSVSVPDEGSVDEWLVGFDGREGTELTFKAGETAELSVLLSGKGMGILGYHNAEALLKVNFFAPNDASEVNDEKIVTEAVESFKKTQFLGQYPISELLDIVPVNSENGAASGTDHKFYSLEIQDLGGSNELGLVQAQYPGSVVKRTDRKGGVSTYTILKVVELDEAVEVLPADFVQDVNGTEVTTSWVAGEAGKAKTETYTIRLADANGTTSRLAELQAAYPDLTIAEVTGSHSPALCQRDYTTTVATNVVFEGCSPAFRDIFESEAPEAYDFVEWSGEEKTYSPTAKMGIKIKAKPTVLAANGEALRHQFPFVNSSIRVAVAGGYLRGVNESNAQYSAGIFNIKNISRATEAANLGGNLMDWEKRGRAYFTGENPHQDNLFARTMYGRESNLDELTSYVTYAIEISRTKSAGGFGATVTEPITYHITAPVGKTDELEAVLNSLATAAGIDTVAAGV